MAHGRLLVTDDASRFVIIARQSGLDVGNDPLKQVAQRDKPPGELE